MPKPKKAPQSKAVNKTEYVLRLPASLSAKEVVAEGKKHGVNLSVAHVYKIRSVGKLRARKAAHKVRASLPVAPKPAAPPRSEAKGRKLSKRGFVLSFAPGSAVADIMKSAKAQGMALTRKYVYNIRSAAKTRGKAPAARRVIGGHAPAATPARVLTARHETRAASRHGSVEEQFLNLVLDLGLSKAGQLLQRVRDKARVLSL